MARLWYGVFLVMLLNLKLGQCEETSEEAAQKEVLGDEYEQIFHSIPTLFEYVLEMLEERPEILEKDDIILFQEVPQEACEGEVKREIKKCGDDSALDEDRLKALKRNIDQSTKITNYDQSTKIGNNYNHSGKITTESPEIATSTDFEITTRGLEDVTNIIGHIKPRNSRNDFKKKAATKFDLQRYKDNSQIKSSIVGKKDRKGKRNVINFGDSFLGLIDWTKLYLSPEEVEEQAIKIEEAIEDHNKKKQR